jgi:hypothetical protein
MIADHHAGVLRLAEAERERLELRAERIAAARKAPKTTMAGKLALGKRALSRFTRANCGSAWKPPSELARLAKLKQTQIVQGGVLKEAATVGEKPIKGGLGGAEPFRGMVAEAEGDVVGRPGRETQGAKKHEREALTPASQGRGATQTAARVVESGRLDRGSKTGSLSMPVSETEGAVESAIALARKQQREESRENYERGRR